ncbi:MAG: GLPGLI family protein [Bacteroides cellulosilyticus]|nr:GLPGLI family protein [Bacteroides cellulosilyticus]
MKKILLVLLVLIQHHLCKGQTTSIGIPSNTADRLIYTHQLCDSTTCEQSIINIAYTLSFKRSAEQADLWEDLIILQIGERLTKQFSAWAYQADSALTVRHRYGLIGNWIGEKEAAERFEKIRTTIPHIPIGQLWFTTTPKEKRYTTMNTEIFKDRESGRYTIFQPEPITNTNEHGFIYEDIPSSLLWNTNYRQTIEIAGYICHKATTSFRGRTWTAWYTPELPFNEGPYKFGGLPGLILKIEDDKNDYTWLLLSIDVHKRPIIRYRNLFQQTTRNKYLRWERSLHANPGSYMANQGVQIEIYDVVNNRFLTPNEYGWTIPYNPIELE